MRRLIPIIATAALVIAPAATSVLAQGYPPAPGAVYVPPPIRPLPRVEITPRVRTQYYRDCVDGYVVEPRLTGPTVVPRMRCHWNKRYYAY